MLFRSDYLLFIGKPHVPFPFSGIGFYRPSEPYKIFYSLFYHTFVYKSDECNTIHEYPYYIPQINVDCWNFENELIEIPIMASPKSILNECGLSVQNTYANRETMFVKYNIDSISPDLFWREYGYRSENEQKSIYRCICKYKYLEYKWFVEHGIEIWISDDDKNDINRFKNIL